MDCYKCGVVVHEATPARVNSQRLWPTEEFADRESAREFGKRFVQTHMDEKYGVDRHGYQLEVTESEA